MKRRTFLKTSATAIGAAGSLRVAPMLAAAGHDSPKSESSGRDNRPAGYLQRAQSERFLPARPGPAETGSIAPMPLDERIRRGIVPKRGFCGTAPGRQVRDALTAGSGSMSIEVMGEPFSEQILFHHERLLMPWKRPLEAPHIADIFSQVRQMTLDGRSTEAMSLAVERMRASPIQENTQPHLTIPAFQMQLDFTKAASAKGYLRTLDFESGEIGVYWTDERGDWARKTFASRRDNIVVQHLAAPPGRTVDVRISLRPSPEWSMNNGMTWGNRRAGAASKSVDAGDVRQNCDERSLTYKCILDPTVDNSGYAGVTRIVRNGGLARVEGGTVVIEGASSVMLLTRIEYFPDYSDDKVESLRKSLEEQAPDYAVLLDRNRALLSEMFNRVTVDFGGAAQYGMSVEELLSDQRSRPDFSPALLERTFEMGRHWFILNSGKYPSIAAGTNSTIDLQTAGAVQGNLREGMEAYFNWMESLTPDCRANARNIFGFRGAVHPLLPDKGMGVNYFYTSGATGAWPYWISAGGWRLRPFWDYYLATGDLEFLRSRVVPAYRELALFYEDFLTTTDQNGNYVFAPSFSPENHAAGTGAPVLVNDTLDIAVCREVLTNLIQACQTLDSEMDSVAKWKAMLAKMPPYLVELDGTLKEWAWPQAQEHYSHRHVSHLYGVWPGDEIDPDRTPQLARAAEIACRRRTFDTMSTAVAGEVLPAYSRCHRALAGARLQDNVIVNVQLRQLLEQGYVSGALRCSRDPYAGPAPDAQAGIPALIMEMLAYSRPGVIELLPALPPAIVKGSIKGLLTRTFARLDNLAWDMNAGSVDLTITSIKNQNVTLVARHGIEKISGSGSVLTEKPEPGGANCTLRLTAGEAAELHLKTGRRNPLDWVGRVPI